MVWGVQGFSIRGSRDDEEMNLQSTFELIRIPKICMRRKAQRRSKISPKMLGEQWS